MATYAGKPINVSLRIISDLSQGLYRSPADALKELVSNAYDADSEIVDINFKKDFSLLTIRDQGEGMTINEFIQAMETIGSSPKRSIDTERKEETQSGRKIIGRIGIGLLGASQIAEEIEIQSTTKNSTVGFLASIEFNQFASEEARKIKITELWEEKKEIQIGKYFIKEIADVEKNAHYTYIRLTGIKRTLINKLRAVPEKDGGQPRVMGKKIFNMEELVKWMRKDYIIKTALHEYDRLFWELCILCPVPYLNNALRIYNKLETTSGTSEFTEFANTINKETHLTLKFDGIDCLKPILMPDKDDRNYQLFFNLLFMKGLDKRHIKYRDYNREGELEEKELKIRGYIYFQKPKIWPPELQGLLVRVRNVAVGQYDSTFLTYRRHEGFKFSQISGEIYVDGLDEVLNIDRSSFRETESAFVAFRDGIHKYLSNTVFPGIKGYATQMRDDRWQEDIRDEIILLKHNFKTIDEKNRKIGFMANKKKLIERKENEIIINTSIENKNLKSNKDFYRILAFLEAKLAKNLSDVERDNLYEELLDWLNKF